MVILLIGNDAVYIWIVEQKVQDYQGRLLFSMQDDFAIIGLDYSMFKSLRPFKLWGIFGPYLKGDDIFQKERIYFTLFEEELGAMLGHKKL